MAKTVMQEFTKGVWAEIPPFRLVLGLCPILAVTKTFENAVGLGVAHLFVLICANILISLLKDFMPKKIRIVCYIITIATFVIVAELLIQAFAYPLFLKLGIFIPLLAVNCIPMARAEAFASKKDVLPSFADGLGLGLGFLISLSALALFREVLGSGTITLPFTSTVIHIFDSSFNPFSFMVEAPGAFVCLGLMLCIMNTLGKK